MAIQRPQTRGFQVNIFFPSSGPNGNRLKNAIHKLIPTPYVTINNGAPKRPAIKNKTPMDKLAMGPATEIIPSSFIVNVFPKIYTAPGATKIKPNNPEKTIANAKNGNHITNWPCAPKCIAVYLCASSCTIKDVAVINKLKPRFVKKPIIVKLNLFVK